MLVKKARSRVLGFARLLTSRLLMSTSSVADSRLWLEDITGEKSLDWCRARNGHTISTIGEPADSHAYKRILEIADSKDKIPHVGRIGAAGSERYYNFWTDATHVKGIWRETTLASFKTASPQWRTVLDIDALNAAEGRTGDSKDDDRTPWVWHGYGLLDEGEAALWDRTLVFLSPGGKDADTAREFDLVSKTFVDAAAGGFALPVASKSSARYRRRDELLVGCAFAPEQMTDSGYPRVVKSWTRGTRLEDATVVFEGEQADISVGQDCYYDRGVWHEMRYRSLTFYTLRQWLRTPDLSKSAAADDSPWALVPVPDDARVSTFGDALTIALRKDWAPGGGAGDRIYKSGSLLVAPVADVLAARWEALRPLFEPTPTTSLAGSARTQHYIVLKVFDDVRVRLRKWRYDGGGAWVEVGAAAGGGGADGLLEAGVDLSIRAVSPDDSDDVFVDRYGYLVPDELALQTVSDDINLAAPPPSVLKRKPAMFDASGLACAQHFTTSADGTRVPYCEIGPRDRGNGKAAPTLLDAYGGFEISLTPRYSGAVGAAWLARGAVKVIANIRGGGEYGPTWHQAALREKRHKAYEDLEAVARDLIARGVTSTPQLGCIGGSNGGLLVGNMLTREGARLFGAIVCQVPLLDMKRYTKLLAGASWSAEYGDPDVPSDWAFLQHHSPYHRLFSAACLGDGKDAAGGDAAAWRAPRTLFTTSTRDDRVHPAHARKMVKALLDDTPAARGGGPDNILYWENIEGGHGGAADNKQAAHMWALSYNFLWQTLTGAPAADDAVDWERRSAKK